MDNLQLENIKTGDEICTMLLDGKCGSLYIVGEFSDQHKRFRLMRGGKHSGFLAPDGLGYYSLSNRETGPHFYYSKNPAHIAQVKQVKQDIAIAAKVKKDKEDQNRKLLKSLSVEINELLAKYGASLYACQTSGDDQGVDVGMFLSIDYQELEIE